MSPARIFMIAGAAVVAILMGLLFQGGNSPDAPPVPQPTAGPEVVTDTDKEEKAQRWILVAGKTLPTGHNIGDDDLGWLAWSADLPAEDFITLDANPDALTKYKGHIVQAPIAAGDPITSQSIIDPGDSGALAALLAPGMRAASVAIDRVRAAGGFIAPKDRVDVVLLKKERLGGRSRETSLPFVLIENVKVLAIDDRLNRAPSGKGKRDAAPSRATLELTPRDAQILAAASDLGPVHLILRGVSDIAGYSGATAAGLGLLPGGRNVPLYSGGQTTDLPIGGR